MLKIQRSGLIAALACGTLFIQPAIAAPHTPKVGSKERKDIMDAMRKVVGKAHKKKIIFVTDHLKVEKGWAYFAGAVTYADGTRPRGEDFMGGNIAVLLRQSNRSWTVKRYIYHGDVIEPDFIDRFPQAPRAIFNRVYR